MSTPTLVVIAVTTLVSCVSLGGAVYEALVVDPFWPKRPGIIQSQNGGISRVRFWLPVHILFEVLLVVTLVLTWGDDEVGAALLVAVVSHAAMRIWSVFYLIPKAVQFERTDPADVDAAAAQRWIRLSLTRLPLILMTCAALLVALAIG